MTYNTDQLRNARIAYDTAVTVRNGTSFKLLAWNKIMLALFEAALIESDFLNLANGDVSASLELPHDDVGGDHDSLGVLQQRASWGSVEQRMDVAYAVTVFIETAIAKDKPSLTAGELAQAVQVSAFPQRYDDVEEEALQLINTFAIPEENDMLFLVQLKNDNRVYLSNVMSARLIANTADLLVLQALLKSKGMDSAVKVVGSLSAYGVSQ
jgi:hypothetical protein